MSMYHLPNTYTRVTKTTVIVPVQDKPDLHEPRSWRKPEAWLTVIPARVEVTLRMSEGTERGDQSHAFVSVIGPRRLKSGAEGKEICTTGWEKVRIDGGHAFILRPDWLTQLLAENLPWGWDPSLMNLQEVSR